MLGPVVRTTTVATYLGDFAHDGYYGSGNDLTSANVARFAMEWTARIGSVISTQPAIYAGVVYFGAWNGYEYAVKAANGAVLWRSYLGRTVTPPSQGCSPAAVGVASSATVAKVGGSLRVITGTGDGQIASLDAATGKIAWERRVAPVIGGFEWSSPAVFHGAVYVGVASFGDCPLVPGKVVTLNAKTGVLEYGFTTPLPKGCSGDDMWSSPTIDSASHLLYITTGNANTAKGRNCYSRFADALLALSIPSLQLVGRWQIPRRREFLNADFGATPTLFTATIEKRTVGLVGAVSKDGVFYALRRGALAAGPVWTAVVADSGACPECGSGSISSAAFDGTNLYVAGGRSRVGGKSCNGSLRDLNPATGKARWADCFYYWVLAAVTETPGVVYAVFGPELEVLSASSGKILFKYFDPYKGSIFYGPVTPSGSAIYLASTDGRLRAFTPRP